MVQRHYARRLTPGTSARAFVPAPEFTLMALAAFLLILQTQVKCPGTGEIHLRDRCGARPGRLGLHSQQERVIARIFGV
jgi:hypothetical protein